MRQGYVYTRLLLFSSVRIFRESTFLTGESWDLVGWGFLWAKVFCFRDLVRGRGAFFAGEIHGSICLLFALPATLASSGDPFTCLGSRMEGSLRSLYLTRSFYCEFLELTLLLISDRGLLIRCSALEFIVPNLGLEPSSSLTFPKYSSLILLLYFLPFCSVLPNFYPFYL